MKRKAFAALFLAVFLLTAELFFPVVSTAGVSININIPLPRLVISAPPALVVIPGTYVYFAPDLDVNIFFYQGYWYRPYGGYWFMAVDYNGPWGSIAIERVPVVLLNLPVHYRRVPPGYERLPYGVVKKNWRTWERERSWDRYERSRGYDEYYSRDGHGWGRGHGRGRHRDD